VLLCKTPLAARDYMTFRLPPEMREGLRAAARLHGRSASGELRAALASHLAATAATVNDAESPTGRNSRAVA
jgi:plasmid stability protein